MKESEEKYRTLVENLNIGVYRNTGGPHGRFMQANPTVIRMFGYNSIEEFMNVPISQLYQNPEDRKNFVEKIKKRSNFFFLKRFSDVFLRIETCCDCFFI